MIGDGLPQAFKDEIERRQRAWFPAEYQRRQEAVRAWRFHALEERLWAVPNLASEEDC